MTITPEQQKIIDDAKQIAKEANLDLSDWNGEFEQRYKDTQASFTKAQQDKIEMAKLLVETDPKNVERIPDEKIRNKVLQEKWGVDNLEELKVMFPDYAKNPDDEEDELTEMEKMKRELKLMKFQNSKTKTKEALDFISLQNKDLIETIPDFEAKINDELKFISESIEPSERVKKAFSLVAGSTGSSADAYSIMQWVTIKKTPKSDIDEATFKKEQNEYRKLLGLKEK